MIDQEWNQIPKRYGCVILDKYVVMPNFTASFKYYPRKMMGIHHRNRRMENPSGSNNMEVD